MSKCKKCPFCGSNLDHGERCDCNAGRKEAEREAAQSAGELATPTPQLMPGA